ncbi:hypothetical protein ACWKSP_24545 [Micromonosporaceae bacterium Da 78-11]
MNTEKALCVCGHQQPAHQHFRRGADCALCGPSLCPRYRRAAWWRRLIPRA